MRIAAIDVGTNSIRLIVADVDPDGGYRVVDDEKEITRLGQGLDATGRLGREAMEKSALVIARMRGIADGYGVERVRAIGTAAVREAANRNEFLALVKERAGVDVEPISAEDEARLAFISVAHAFDIHAAPIAVVDIGGGSTEVVLSSQGVVEQVYTIPLGAVRLAERIPGCATGDPRSLRRMRQAVKEVVRAHIEKPPFVPQYMVGTGGTFTALGSVSMHRGAGPEGPDMLPFALRGYELHRSEVKHVLDWLDTMPVRQRLRVPGLSADRAELIVPGLAIAERVMKRLKANALRVHDRGIRDGLLLTMISERFPRSQRRAAEPVDRWRALRHFAGACRYEELHSAHVADLAVRIFDQIVELRPDALGEHGDAFARDILYAAGLLHDVGYLINYSKHHKHSYHLIVHSDITGFSHRELELIANIARYHRRSEPKKKHLHYAKLPRADRALVRRLSGILRVADGLDRTHTQTVRDVRLHLAGDDVLCRVEAEENPAVDIWGAERKCRLFARSVGLTPTFEWAGQHTAEEALPARGHAPVPAAMNGPLS